MASPFPAALDTDATLFVAKDNISTTLNSAMLIGDTVAVVVSSTGWAVDMIATVESEQMLVTAVAGNILTVTRAYAGTSAAAHAKGKAVSNFVDAIYHESSKSAILAIQAALGQNLSNVVTGASIAASAYNFTPQVRPGNVNLVIGANAIALSPPPAGITAASNGIHSLYIANGTGTPEVVPVNSVVGNVVNVTCAATHTGNWTIGSATLGMQEAAIYLAGTAASAGRIALGPGLQTMYGRLTIPAALGVSIRGCGKGITYIQRASAVVGSPGLGGNWFVWQTGSGEPSANIDLGDFSTNNLTGTEHTGGAIFLIQSRIKGCISNLEIKDGYDAIIGTYISNYLNFDNLHITFAAHNAISLNGTQGNVFVTDSVISARAFGISVAANTVVPGLYIDNCLFDSTAASGTVNSACFSFIEGAATAINEIIIDGCDIESMGVGMTYTGNSTSIINNSVSITGGRWNCRTYGISAQGKVGGIKVDSVFFTISSVNAAAAIFASDVTDLDVKDCLANLQDAATFFIQGAGTVNDGWHISGNRAGRPGGATLTNAVALPNGITNVLIDETNDWTGVTTPVNNATGCTNVRVRGYTGTLVSAASVTLPVTDNFTITGTTAMSTVAVNQGVARFGWITAPSGVSFTASSSVGNSFALPAGVPVPYFWDTAKIWLGSLPAAYPALNYIATEGGANNAITGTLTGAVVADGLTVTVQLAHSLQAGANTFALNGGTALGIKSSRNPANNIATAYAATGRIHLSYTTTGPLWLDLGQ